MRGTLHRLRHSLRGRLLLGTVAWVLVSVLVAGWALTDLFRQHLTRQLAAELAVYENQLIASLSVDEYGLATLAFEPSDPRLQLPYSGLYWQIDRLATDTVPEQGIFRSRSLWDQTLTVPANRAQHEEGRLQTLADPRGSPLLALVRTITPPEGAATYRLIVASGEETLSAPLSQFSTMLAIFLGLLALGLGAAAVVQLVVSLRPLADLRRRLSEVRAGKSSNIDGRFPSELQPLVDEFNAVLLNNNEIVQRARTQAGNLAHAIKTPLSVLANASENEVTPFGKLVSEQVRLASRQVEHHLARARAAAAVRTLGIRTEVLPVLQGLTRVLTRLYAAKGVRVKLDGIDGDWVFRGEQQDLQEMMGNLMENACKWADREVRVSVKAQVSTPTGVGATSDSLPEPAIKPEPDGDMMLLQIEDDGPGLPEAQREDIFQRGVRMDERTPGSGLGLAIVRDLASTYGGSVCAEASEQGGLRIMLVLPGGRS